MRIRIRVCVGGITASCVCGSTYGSYDFVFNKNP